jgi:hypothetical protein
MPKSGSHLINQVLQGLPQLGPFINPGFPPVNRDELNEKLPDTEVVANLQRMRSGDIGYGYLKRREPFGSLLTQPGWASVFVYRDPRDMIVSHVFYATQCGAGMHPITMDPENDGEASTRHRGVNQPDWRFADPGKNRDTSACRI